MNQIRKMRLGANLTLKQVAEPMGRSFEWLRKIEIGKAFVQTEVESKIFSVIEHLKQIKAINRQRKRTALAGFKLPRSTGRTERF